MAKKLTIGSRAVAVAIVAEAINAARKAMPQGVDWSPQELAEQLVTEAYDVEYKPNAERLVIVLDAGLDYDPARGAPQAQEQGPVTL